MRQLKNKYVRMKKKSKEKTPILKPHMEWQTGEYARLAKIRFALPYQFLLLCRLTDVTPFKVITDFTEALDGGNSLHPVSDDCKEHIVDYFISRGYGQQHYTPEELRRMFKEMQGVRLLFPETGGTEMVELYAAWRKEHFNWWFDKWFHKSRRNPSDEIYM